MHNSVALFLMKNYKVIVKQNKFTIYTFIPFYIDASIVLDTKLSVFDADMIIFYTIL